MDVVGSEIGQKMRSAIKAKLTELGCYVDDELPDYVMVMVANKRTRAQMEDDLQLFLGDNTELFVNWLHQVLKKLQEVTVAAPKPPETEKSKEKERSLSKDRKSKEKKSKDKTKKSDLKKAKKKEKHKVKSLRKKELKRAHKKKKSKDQEMIRPNIPPLLMNMEKDTEPSITDVFAGQILKNHGILVDVAKEDPKETKPVIEILDPKRPIVPIIDPATILSQPETSETGQESQPVLQTGAAPREEQLKEISQIEVKIQGLKQKLAEQLDSMSEDDEDFLNIRTEAEELINDFADDVYQEISNQTPAVATPPSKNKSPSPIKSPKPQKPKSPIETLPQIELKLPKRPIRERLGTREDQKKTTEGDRREQKQKEERKRVSSPESFTPERELEPPRSSHKSAKSRVSSESKRKLSSEGSTDKPESTSKKLNSRVSVLENRPSRSTCASVVRVRPRPRAPATASTLLMRAVADAHKSLFNIPPKIIKEPAPLKRALVLPMRRLDAQKIVISVPGRADDDQRQASQDRDPDSDDNKSYKVASDTEKDDFPSGPPTKKTSEFKPGPLTMKIQNTDYLPSRRLDGRTATRKDDNIIIETINIHNQSVDKDKNTQFIVTMDGFNPNAFLAKKLQTEGLLNDDDDLPKEKLGNNKEAITPTEKEAPKITSDPVNETLKKRRLSDSSDKSKDSEKSKSSEKSEKSKANEKGNASETSKPSEINKASEKDNVNETIPTDIVIKEEKIEKHVDISSEQESPPVKKRRSSPIVFDVGKKDKEREKVRERTESVGSDNHVTVTTTTGSHKYDALPPLTTVTTTTEAKKPVWCRSFPQCGYGASCLFLHPRCKFAASCTRRHCPYSHSPADAPLSPAPVIASHVVPAANYKSISATPLPAMCKFYPACVNPACHFYHPKPCRYGKMCVNKLECNFYHADVPASKWRYAV